jgi:hypothetical protein
MTHSLMTAAGALLCPKRLFSVFELRNAPTIIPKEGGIYAWWFSKVPPGVPVDETAIQDGRWLLYVGIAPRKPSAAGSVSKSTLRDRLLTHCRGPLALSTLRRTVAVLLASELGLSITLTASEKFKMSTAHETRPTQWMNENARVIWVTNPAPWEVEEHLIQGPVRLPLNIQGSSDPFAKVLSNMRSRIRQKGGGKE